MGTVLRALGDMCRLVRQFYQDHPGGGDFRSHWVFLEGIFLFFAVFSVWCIIDTRGATAPIAAFLISTVLAAVWFLVATRRAESFFYGRANSRRR